VGLTLPDHGAIAIAIPVVVAVTLANGYTGPNGTNANADFIGQCRRCKGANRRGNQQKLLHDVLLMERGTNGP
jgi:hypothetical protein